MAKSVAALRVLGQIVGGSDDFKCGLKDIFRDAFYIYTHWCTHLCARESAERFTSLRLSRHSMRLSLCFPHDAYTCHTSLWNPVYGMRANLRRATLSSTTDNTFGNIREFMWRLNYVAVV